MNAEFSLIFFLSAHIQGLEAKEMPKNKDIPTGFVEDEDLSL